MARSRRGTLSRWSQGSGPTVLVVTLGVLIRILTMLASGPISLYLNDSKDYLARARDLKPNGYHPLGYSFFLRISDSVNHPLLLSVLQHLIGLGVGVGVLLIARRLRLPPWGAALAAAPQLLDPYVAVSEQFVIAETLFTALLVAAVWCAINGRGIPAGLLIAAATLTRTIAIPVIILLLLALPATRPGGRRLLIAGAAAVLPVLAYAGFFANSHGHLGLTENSGIYIYGRMAPFAECAKTSIPAGGTTLCDTRPVALRPDPDFYLWAPAAPLKHLGLTNGQRSSLAGKTGYAMVRGNIGAWIDSTLYYTLHYADPVRNARVIDSTLSTWIVSDRIDTAPAANDPRLSDGYRTTDHVNAGPTKVLRWLQQHVVTPVWLYAILALVGLLGVGTAGVLRRTWAVCSVGVLLLLGIPSATVGWDIRFLLPALPLLGLAAGAGVLLARDRG